MSKIDMFDMNKAEILELAAQHEADNPVLASARQRYNRATDEMLIAARKLEGYALDVSDRVSCPFRSFLCNTSEYVIAAAELATAERLAREALTDIRQALMAANICEVGVFPA